MLGQALYTSFGGGAEVFPGGGQLADEAATQRAICWGLAMRLAQRLSGGTRSPLERSQLKRKGGKLELHLPGKLSDLYGYAVAKRHAQLGAMLNLEPRLISTK